MAETSNVELWLSFDNLTNLALSIPIAECEKYAVNPLKWLRFLGYAIYGQEGYLSTSIDGPDISDYTTEIEARPYYFVSQGEPCLVDIDALEARTSDATDVTERRREFRQSIVQRDGMCVVTGDPARTCEACHLLPHSKGANYIFNVILYRGGGSSLDDFEGIDDPRNGLLLYLSLHQSFGRSESAFLKTPNFALTVDDIPSDPRHADEDIAMSRLTLHRFVDASISGNILNLIAPNNSDARRPDDTTNWPPAVIFDYIYAVAVLQAWGPRVFRNYVREQTRSIYYSNLEAEAEDDDDHMPGGGPVHTDAQGRTTSTQAPQHGYNLHSGTRPTGRVTEVMEVVAALWMRSAKIASDSRRNEHVKTWLESVDESSKNSELV